MLTENGPLAEGKRDHRHQNGPVPTLTGIITLSKHAKGGRNIVASKDRGPENAGAPRVEVTLAMLVAGEAALLDVFPEEVLSWRTPGVKIACGRVYAAMEEVRAADDGRGPIVVRVPSEFDLSD
jgi:hypothetical protein